MNLYTTRDEAAEREIRQPLAAGTEDLLPEPRADGTCPTVEDCYDIDAIADEVITTTVTAGGRPRRCQDPSIGADLLRETVERHARPADAEGQGPVARAVGGASRLDRDRDRGRGRGRGRGLDEDGYTARLLSTVPPGSRYPGYTDLLEVAAASAGHLRWLDPRDPWPVLDEEAEEACRRLAGRTGSERLSDLASEIGTWLTDGGEPATLAIGGLALAWAAALLED